MISLPIPRRALLGAGLGISLGFGSGSTSAQGLSRFTGRTAGTGVVDHGGFDALLARWARSSADGVVRVNYAGWKRSTADRDALKRYIDLLTALDPLTLTRAEQFAYWANL